MKVNKVGFFLLTNLKKNVDHTIINFILDEDLDKYHKTGQSCSVAAVIL